MIQLKRIFPECYADTLLVEKILQRGVPAHYHGISNVSIAMERYLNLSEYILGIVDKDKFKTTPKYINKFKIIDDRSKDEGIIILHLEHTKHYIIRICPAFDRWVWDTAKNCGIEPHNYGFNDFEKLMKVAKSQNVKNNTDFNRFLNAIIKNNPPAIQILRYWMDKVFN